LQLRHEHDDEHGTDDDSPAEHNHDSTAEHEHDDHFINIDNLDDTEQLDDEYDRAQLRLVGRGLAGRRLLLLG
jgi:hypothetical protein